MGISSRVSSGAQAMTPIAHSVFVGNVRVSGHEVSEMDKFSSRTLSFSDTFWLFYFAGLMYICPSIP